MDSNQTKIVRIEVDGKIMRQMTLQQPVTLAEAWKLPEVVALGPARSARLGPDGIVYVRIDLKSFKAWRKLLVELLN